MTETTTDASVRASLHDYETGEYIRPATQEELDESVSAAECDGGAGVIDVDGRRCFACAD